MANRTVLLIDYEPRSIEDTRRPLEEAGYSVEIAHDGVAGLEAFHRVHPALVLVEAMLPKKHGFDVCQEIKNSADGKDTPVVITTGVYRGRKYRNQALQNFGCDEYLEKPFTDDALLDACNRFIALEIVDRKSTSEESSGGSQTAAAPVEPKPADAAGSGALDLERMTEDEISSRLDSLLADFGEAVDVAAESAEQEQRPPAPEATASETAGMPHERESIFDTDSKSADRPTEVAASSAPVESENVADSGPSEASVDTAEAPAGPASAVFGTSTDGGVAVANVDAPDEPSGDASAAAPAMDDADLIPTVPVAGRGPERDLPDARDVDSDLRADIEVAKAPTKSTVLENRPATPATPAARRWLLPAVAVVVLGAIVTTGAIWMNGRAADDDVPAVESRAPVTFAPSAAARAGFAEDGPGETGDGSVTATGEPQERIVVVQDPSASTPGGAVAAPVTESTSVPAVRVPDPAPVASSAVASKPEPRPTVTKTAEVAERRPSDVPVATRPDPKPVKVAAPAVAAQPPPTVMTTEPVEDRSAAVDTAPVEARPTAVESTPTAVQPALTTAVAEVDLDPVVTTRPPSVPEPIETAPVTAAESAPRAVVVPAKPAPPPVRAGDLVEFTEVDTEPVAVSKIAPRYNAVAKQAKQQGDVVLNVLVDENGAVADVEVLKGVEGSMLDDAAIRAVRKWTYEPATKDGVPVKVWTMEIISFRL